MNITSIDPVCGMDVALDSPLRAEHEGITYRFCSEHCRDKFVAAPEKFVKPAGEHHHEASTGERGRKWTDYIPLLVIVALTLLAACAKQIAAFHGAAWDWMSWMHDFMGFFLVVFSMFKFFNLEGFADGFQMYDLLAKPFRTYAYVYPFIELALGLAFLAHWQPKVTYIATIIVTVFGSLGVINALRRHLDINCACMGTVLKVPLSTVAMVEDLGMAAMAAAMLVSG